MLETASAPLPMPAASAASAAAARPAVKDEAGFQGRLREALDMPAPEEKAAQEPPQAKPADRPFQEAAKPEAETEAEAAASKLSAAGEKLADAPAEMAAPEAPSSAPLVSTAVLPQGALSLQAATPQLAQEMPDGQPVSVPATGAAYPPPLSFSESPPPQRW